MRKAVPCSFALGLAACLAPPPALTDTVTGDVWRIEGL